MEDIVANRVDEQLQNLFNKFKFKLFTTEETGIVTRVNDSIVEAIGFTNISSQEKVLIQNRYVGVVFVINDTKIKIVLLDRTTKIKIGDSVRRTGKQIRIGVGEAMLGRILDGLGRPIDGKGVIKFNEKLPVERPAKDIMDRESVNEPLETGIKVIDALIPIGKGQRELILGDKQTGKTSIVLDTIIHQKNTDVICIYCAIGQRDSSMANVLNKLQISGAMNYTIVIHAGSSELPGQQYIAPYAATSIAEYFMEQGKDVLIVYDDLTKHARAYREISLLLETNPGREAYPADIFYIHSKLLERSTKMNKNFGGGSITSLPIIETEAENVSAYIPTNVISITDGQIYLTPGLFQKGILPAIDVGTSVSRVGSAAQLPAYKQVIGSLGIEYAQFEELESFSKFSTNLEDETQTIIDHGKIIREIFKQDLNNTLNAEEQIAIFLSLNNHIFDGIKLDYIKNVEELIVEVLKEEGLAIINCVKDKQKIPQDLIDNFILNVKKKLEKTSWKA